MDAPTGTYRDWGVLQHPTTGAALTVDSGWRVIGIGDLNGDGKGDIVWRNGNAQAVSIWQMNGKQVVGMTAPNQPNVSSDWNLLAVADLNGDRKADLLWQHSSGGVVSWLMDGAVLVGGGGVSNTPGAGYKLEAVNDFSGDGRADLLWRNSSGAMTLLLSMSQSNPLNPPTYQAGSLNFQGSPLTSLGLEWQIAGTDDFSGDGKADIVWRHQTLGNLSIWGMDGFQVGSQIASVANVDVKDLSRKPVGAATRPDEVNIIQLAGISDSGSKNDDGITNVRTPTFAGVTSAGNTVSLFANNQLIGETKATVTGTWEIKTTALEDGVYTISQKVTNAAGGFTQQVLPQQLTIDGTAPEVQVTGPIDGVAWGAQIELAGYLRDLDPEAKVEYSVNTDGTLAFSAVMGATIDNSTVPNPSLTKKTIATTQIDLGPATGTQTFKPYEVALTVTDRAGNISTQTYKGMRLNLPELTEESVLLPDSLMPTLPDERNPLNPSNPNNPNNPGDGNNRPLYIGLGGAWGHGTTGGGGGWTWSPGNPGSGNGGGFPDPPPHIGNPDDRIGYLPALRLALTTARDVLSNVPATAAKKDSLKRHLDMLMKMGEVVDNNGFYEAMRPLLKSVFATAYAEGGITKRQAVWNGWGFARALAVETKLTTLQIFEANLYATSLVALKQNGSTASTAGLQQTIEGLATTYAKLQTVPNGRLDYNIYVVYGSNVMYSRNTDFLGSLLHDSRKLSDGSQIDPSWVIQRAIADLSGHLQGQIDPVRSLQMVDRMLQAATQIKQLHEDSYQYKDNASNGFRVLSVSNSIRDTSFLNNLSELAFEIARVNPTVTLGANPTSEWVETLWEGGDVLSAAGGLSELFSGFATEAVSVRRDKMGQAIDYMGRLVQAADAVDDPLLDKEVLKGDFLSHLVNLGGAYTGVMQGGAAPDYQVAMPNSPLFPGMNFFLDILWNTSDEASVQRTGRELVDYYRLFDTGKNTHSNRVAALKLQGEILRTSDQTPYLWQSLSEPFLLAPLFVQDGGDLKVSTTSLGQVVAQSNEAVYTGIPPWEAKATQLDFKYAYGDGLLSEGQRTLPTSPLIQKVYNEEQRLWAWKIIKDYAEDIKNIALEYMVTPDAIAGAILWEAVENPYPLYRSMLPQGVPISIPIASRMGIPGKIHVRQSNPLNFKKTVAEKIEDEKRVASLSKPGDWKERAKRLSDPKWAIRYIGAILDRAADIYEDAAGVGKEYDRDYSVPERDYFNLRDQAGILGALYQGGKEEERAENFEKRRNVQTYRTVLLRSLEDSQKLLNVVVDPIVPQMTKEETMGPWISQYRWLIRDRLEIYGIQPFGIDFNKIETIVINVDTGAVIFTDEYEITRTPEITNKLLPIPISPDLLKQLKVSTFEELIQLSRQGKYE
jgi:Bacterial Ig-like domain/FG-GAP-like repeat